MVQENHLLKHELYADGNNEMHVLFYACIIRLCQVLVYSCQKLSLMISLSIE